MRYEVMVEAANAAEAERAAEHIPYEQWQLRYVSNEDVVAYEEDPRNPHAE